MPATFSSWQLEKVLQLRKPVLMPPHLVQELIARKHIVESSHVVQVALAIASQLWLVALDIVGELPDNSRTPAAGMYAWRENAPISQYVSRLSTFTDISARDR